MQRNRKTILVTLSSILIVGGTLLAQHIGEGPALPSHMSESDIESGKVSFAQMVQQGRLLFTTAFNKYDGQGRPRTDSNGESRPSQAAMIRMSGPEAHSCVACHNWPRTGGSGDFSSNVFEMADNADPTAASMSPQIGNERLTPGVFGDGALDMLAREMTTELIAARNMAVQRAYLSAQSVPVHLIAKGIDFGTIVVHPDGTFDKTGVRGVSGDLVVRPFHQNGDTVSLRQVANDAMNQHLGMQSAEKFGENVDPDGDGVVNELTTGDVTALAIYQAQLGVPGRVIPDDPARRHAAADGEVLFDRAGCTTCHVPAMQLTSTLFAEPNPFNPEWKLPLPVLRRVTFDMTTEGEMPRLEANGKGGAIVRAYTDLKRHNLCDAQDSFFCNEKVVQKGIELNTFITRRLWDVGTAVAFGHRGDLSTMTDAISHHAGEARPSLTNFMNLSPHQQAAIIEFLKTMQILPPGSERVISESALRKLQTAEPNY